MIKWNIVGFQIKHVGMLLQTMKPLIIEMSGLVIFIDQIDHGLFEVMSGLS